MPGSGVDFEESHAKLTRRQKRNARYIHGLVRAIEGQAKGEGFTIHLYAWSINREEEMGVRILSLGHLSTSNEFDTGYGGRSVNLSVLVRVIIKIVALRMLCADRGLWVRDVA